MMRTLPAPTLAALASTTNRCNYVRVLIEDPDGDLQDISERLGLDWLHGLEIAGDIDQLARTISLQLRRDFGIPAQNLSLAPAMEGSIVNRDVDDFYAPWVDVSRPIEVWTAILEEPGVPDPEDWHLVFAGALDSWDSAQNPMPLAGRDGYAQLLDRQIEVAKDYSDEDGEPAEDIIQEILDDNSTGVTLFVPASPGVDLVTFPQDRNESVGEAIASLAEQFGWNIRQRFDEGTGTYRTTLFDVDPDDLTPVYTYDAGTYYRLRRFLIDSTDVRNRILGVFTDPTSGNYVSVPAVEDADSIAEHGVRTAVVVLGSDSPIRTPAELTTLLEVILAALKDPSASVEVEAPWNPFLEEGDVVEFAADNRNTDVDVVVAVKALRHSYAPGHERTIIIGRARPAGAYLRWRKLARERREQENAAQRARILSFGIQEVNDAQGQRTKTTIVLGERAARWQLYERDGTDWPTLDGSEGGVPDSDPYGIGTFDATKTSEQRSVAPSTTRRAIAIALNAEGRAGDRASASVTTGLGGVGTEPPALLFQAAEQDTTQVRAWWVVNDTITGDPGRYVVDVYRDSLIIAQDVPAEDEEAFDTDAVPCGGGTACEYFAFNYRFVLRDTSLVHPTIEYSAPLAGMWESFTL